MEMDKIDTKEASKDLEDADEVLYSGNIGFDTVLSLDGLKTFAHMSSSI